MVNQTIEVPRLMLFAGNEHNQRAGGAWDFVGFVPSVDEGKRIILENNHAADLGQFIHYDWAQVVEFVQFARWQRVAEPPTMRVVWYWLRERGEVPV